LVVKQKSVSPTSICEWKGGWTGEIAREGRREGERDPHTKLCQKQRKKVSIPVHGISWARLGQRRNPTARGVVPENEPRRLGQ